MQHCASLQSPALMSRREMVPISLLHVPTCNGGSIVELDKEALSDRRRPVSHYSTCHWMDLAAQFFRDLPWSGSNRNGQGSLWLNFSSGLIIARKRNDMNRMVNYNYGMLRTVKYYMVWICWFMYPNRPWLNQTSWKQEILGAWLSQARNGENNTKWYLLDIKDRVLGFLFVIPAKAGIYCRFI